MSDEITTRALRVAQPPSRPLLIWDGDCHFCRRWVERWRETTKGAVDYVPLQEIGERFSEIPRTEFERGSTLVEPDGAVSVRAQAVFRALRCRFSRKWLSWSYDRIPGFAAISELAYRVISRNRATASFFTRLVWGEDVRPPSYFRARRWFLRSLGIIYAIAFVSLWVQIDGLVGANGILPIADFLPAIRQQVGTEAFWLLPTLCWVNSSNAFLHLLCAAGVLFSVLLIFEIVPAICLALLFVCYLSLTAAGQTFLSFQWDILLLETGFLAIFLAPWRLWPRRSSMVAGVPPPRTAIPAADAAASTATPVSKPALFLLKFLLFKLMLMSGVVKLTSGDPSWGWVDHHLHWNAMTALDYHYWSQPLPTVFAWYADKTPEWFKHFSVAACLFIEIVVPFFIWAPRRPRLVAGALLIFLQIVIAITGNYCFFNLLTVALCLLLIDDAVICRGSGSLPDGTLTASPTVFGSALSVPGQLSVLGAAVAIVATLPLNAWLIYSAFKPEVETPGLIRIVYERLEPFRVANGYGLFRVMTKDRGEIIVEGSSDGVDWRPYEFRWKPGDVMRAPGWCAPHQPRLDWQMWFAALGSARDRQMFFLFERCLLEGKPAVAGLLRTNPFPTTPPRYVRAGFYRYRFTTAEEREQTGAWWKREELGEYFRSFSLEDLKRGP